MAEDILDHLVTTSEGLMTEAQYREMVTRRAAKERARAGEKYTTALREEQERYDRENH